MVSLMLAMVLHVSAKVGVVLKDNPDPLTYKTIPNDPLKARIYKLRNGLTVYLTVYKNEPRIQTFIAVKAGSKNDPSDATGLAHYLEHMLFKGTDKFGSLNYGKEKPELDKIVDLYEIYRATKDTLKRKSIYHAIDSISGVAAKYAIANEYDKMLSVIGAKGTNAFTSFEETVYVNDIPSNQLENWLTIEGERYRNPVLRLFHTELEAVYEEKNRNLDSDESKLFESLLSGLFQKHTYGTQTTIGSIDHLKNPSLKKIMEYYQSYYVPNNMAICLSGDFNPDEAIQLIDKKFGSMTPRLVEDYTASIEAPINTPVVKEVYGPDAETMVLAYRFGGAYTKDADMLTIIDKIFYNGLAGLIDLNLKQSQKVLDAVSSTLILKDYSLHLFSADPREGQSLEQLRDLLLEQIEKLKKGDFSDDLLQAIITDMKYKEAKSFENNADRAYSFVESFILGQDWKWSVEKMDRLSKITKNDIIDFANKNYKSNNYVIVYKHTGDDKNIQKVLKPAITPVEVNRDKQSPFLKNISSAKISNLQPVFLDYTKDINHFTLNKNNVGVNYKFNEENNTFDLYYVLNMGANHDKKIALAVMYLPYLGTSTLSASDLQKELYKLGCSFSVNTSDDRIYLNLSGLQENFSKALKLFENLLADPKADQLALGNLVKDVLKKREDAKLDKSTILWSAMYSYGKYGDHSPYKFKMSEAELNSVLPEQLTDMIRSLTSYTHHILYYGPMERSALKASLDSEHKMPNYLLPIPPENKFEEMSTDENKVFVVDYDMKQAEIIMLSKSVGFTPKLYPETSAFNEYFGGNMSSVVFQEMRESKALAYSVFSGYRFPARTDRSNYLFAYIGTQADKLPEAMLGMKKLMNEMPESSGLFEASKEAVIQRLRTERITKSEILFNYEEALKLNLDHDVRKDIFEKLPSFSMIDLKKFHETYVKNKSYTILVLGKKDQLDLKTLEGYGKVKFLSLQDVFGY